MSINKTRQKLLIPFKEKYATGNYIIVSGKHIIEEPNWGCFDLQEIYIHKKDKEVLKAFLKDPKVKIEVWTSYNDFPYVPDGYCSNFLEDYNEEYQYKMKKE